MIWKNALEHIQIMNKYIEAHPNTIWIGTINLIKQKFTTHKKQHKYDQRDHKQ